MNDGSGSPTPAIQTSCHSPDGATEQYVPENSTPTEVDSTHRYSPNTVSANQLVNRTDNSVSLNLSPIGQRSSTSGDSSHNSGSDGTTDGPVSLTNVQSTSPQVMSSAPPIGGILSTNQNAGPISSAIQNTLVDYRNQGPVGSSAPPQLPTTPDYSNYYSAFYQAHTDPNSLSPHPNSHYFPNHQFTVSSLIQKPGSITTYPKL